MAGINPNLGKNLNIKQADLQFTAKVDVNKPDEQEGNAVKSAAVWYTKKDHNKDNPKYKLGDVVIFFNDLGVNTFRRIMKPDGSLGWQRINVDDIMPEDYEANRGDLHSPI